MPAGIKFRVKAFEVVPAGKKAFPPVELSIVNIPPTVVTLENVFNPPERVRLLNVEAVEEMVWVPVPLKTTVPVPGVNRFACPFQAVGEVEFMLIVAVLPSNDPCVSVTSPVNVCVTEPRSKVPAPLVAAMFKAPPLTLPAKVAVPALLPSVTGPVVVNPAIDWLNAAPANVIPPVPLVKVPVMDRSPPSVRRFAPGVNVPLMISGILSFKALGPARVIGPELTAIVMPP